MEEKRKLTEEEFRAQLTAANSPEELIKIVKAYNVELTPEKAQNLYDQLHAEGELSDDALEGVAGGSGFTDFFKGVWEEVKKTVYVIGDFFGVERKS